MTYLKGRGMTSFQKGESQSFKTIWEFKDSTQNKNANRFAQARKG